MGSCVLEAFPMTDQRVSAGLGLGGPGDAPDRDAARVWEVMDDRAVAALPRSTRHAAVVLRTAADDLGFACGEGMPETLGSGGLIVLGKYPPSRAPTPF